MTDRAQFVQEMKSGIGGSMAAAILGYSPWQTPMDAYLFYTTPATEESEKSSLPMEVGSFLEPFIVRKYMAETGYKVLTDSGLLTCPDKPFLIAHVDGRVLGDQDNIVGLLEAKTASERTAWKWGEQGTQDIPRPYFCQIQHYMYVCDLPWADVAVLIGNSDFRVYRIKRDDEYLEMVIPILEDFWTNNVMKRIAPAIDGSEASRRYLLDKYPGNDDVIAEVTSLDGGDYTRIQALKETVDAYKEAEEQLDLAKNRVMEIIGDNAGVRCDLGKITWKRNKDSEKTDWKTVAAALASFVDDATFAAIVSNNTETKPGTRVFRMNWSK